MMTSVDQLDQDDDVQTVVTAKNPNDPPGDYFQPPPQSPSDNDRDEYGDDDDDDHDDLASLSTMDTYTFRRLRDRRLRQHGTCSRGDVGHRRMDVAERGHNSIHVRDANNGDGNSSFFSSSSSMSMRGVSGRHPTTSSTNDHGKHPQRRFMGKQRQQQWTQLASSFPPNETSIHPKSSSSRKNGVCNSNRFGLHTGSIHDLSWQHAMLYLGMMGFCLVIWMTVSEMITTMNTEKSSNDYDHYRVVGLETNNIIESGEKFNGGGANSELQDYAGNYNNTTEGNNSENQDFDDENAVLLTFHAMEDSAERPLENNIEVFDSAGEAAIGREEAGMDKGSGVQGQEELQQQLSLQPQPQVEQRLQSPPPPSSSSSSTSASLPAENKTVEQKSSHLISDIQDQGYGGLTVGEEKEGGVVILANNNNNTSIYYDGIANDNPRLWGVKQ